MIGSMGMFTHVALVVPWWHAYANLQVHLMRRTRVAAELDVRMRCAAGCGSDEGRGGRCTARVSPHTFPFRGASCCGLVRVA